MNKQQASQIIQAYQDYRHWDDCIAYPIPELDELNDALDFAIKELWKPDGKITKRQFKYNEDEKDDILFWELYGSMRNELSIPSFAWTCTKCWEPAEKPEYTLCKTHFDLWTNSKLTRTNYTHLVHIDSPKEVREYYNIWDIYENKWMCPKCDDVIQSLNHYDYVKCSCWHSFIDGGSDYSRHSAGLINLSVWFNHK